MPKRSKILFRQRNRICNDDETREARDDQAEEKEQHEEINTERNLNGGVRSIQKKKRMRFLKHNQSNEIERLLLYNSAHIIYVVDHSDLPSFNVGVWPEESAEFLATFPSLAFSVPRPIYVTNRSPQRSDLCYKRPLAWDFHRNLLNLTRTVYQKALTMKTVKNAEKNDYYHPSVFELAERNLLHPDPYFKGSYDYYYTGGNLSTLRQTGSVVHTSGDNLQTLELSEFSMIDDYTVPDSLRPVAKYTSSEGEIFEVQPMLTSSDRSGQNCFIARQRNVITLNCLNENQRLKIISQFRTKSTPFISFSQSDRDPNKLLITTMKQHVRQYDLGSNVPRLVKLFEIEPKGSAISWNTIKPWRENTFLYANQFKFCMIDIRTAPEQWMSSAMSADHSHFLCDHISAIKPSDFNNIFYVATHHKLFCMDVRHIKNSSFNEPEAVICRWSHQLQYPPLMMDTYRLRNNEYIALSSPVAGDLHICQLSRKRNDQNLTLEISKRVPKHIYRSSCLPYQPPTLMEAYEHARLSGSCLLPAANMRTRLQSCTTGLSFSKPSPNGTAPDLALLLTSNSLGDIFVHNLTKREGQEGDSRGNTQSDVMMSEFAKTLEEQKHPLNYTYRKNMKAMRKVFLCKYLNLNLKLDLDAMDDSFSENENHDRPPVVDPITLPVKKKRKRLHIGRWQKSFASLHSYKDVLVKDLLSIWDIEMEKEQDISLGNLGTSLNSKNDPSLKVQDWLDDNINPNPPMISIPPLKASEYMEIGEADISLDFNQTQNTTDFADLIQSTQIMDTTTTQLDMSYVDPAINNTTMSMDRSNTRKKSKKYVKGF